MFRIFLSPFPTGTSGKTCSSVVEFYRRNYDAHSHTLEAFQIPVLLLEPAALTRPLTSLTATLHSDKEIIDVTITSKYKQL